MSIRRKVFNLFLISIACMLLLGCAMQSRKSFTFIQMCDTQLGMGGYENDVKRFENAVKKANESKADFVMICGDLVDKPEDKSYEDFLRIRNGLTIPCYYAPGNHDVGNTPTDRELAKYRAKIGKDYFTAEHKGCSFIFVNTQILRAGAGEEYETQFNWLINALEEASKKKNRIFVAGHIPLYLQTPDEKDEYFNFPTERRKKLLDLFEKYKVKAMITGHTHKFIENKYKDMLFVSGETTCVNFDKHPFGYRVWSVTPENISHEFIALDIQEEKK